MASLDSEKEVIHNPYHYLQGPDSLTPASVQLFSSHFPSCMLEFSNKVIYQSLDISLFPQLRLTHTFTFYLLIRTFFFFLSSSSTHTHTHTPLSLLSHFFPVHQISVNISKRIFLSIQFQVGPLCYYPL